MKEDQYPYKELLPHLFRQEYAKMTAVLCRHFGFDHMEIAEDIASETFLKASESWTIYGIPEKPIAWLYTVAKNRAKDHIKHDAVVEAKVREFIDTIAMETEQSVELGSPYFADSQLSMIFAVCGPTNPPAAQICLALQILCGFSVKEIANALLEKTETVKKRLLRARAKLRNENFQIETLIEQNIKARLATVLETLYLLFNEGYFSRTEDEQIRKEFCSEAIRLALLLTEHPLTGTPETKALLALMCFQSSRLEARRNGRGENVLFEDQDTSLWDKALVEKGNYFLITACQSGGISKYHLEAGIAYWHTTPTAKNKWQHILQLYDQLILIEYSPVTFLNRAFAFAKVYGHEMAITEVEQMQLAKYIDYHKLLGYLYDGFDAGKAISHYRQALQLAKSKTEKTALQREIKRLRAGAANG